MTIPEARKLGWTIERGAYCDTVDDRVDRWYAYKLSTYHAIDRRGSGFRTRRQALEAVERYERRYI